VVSRAALVAIAVALSSACAPTFDDSTSIISAPRLLAVQSTPAEAVAGGAFSLSALYVGPQGVQTAPQLDWATCLLQTPSDQPGPVNPACFGSGSSDVVSLGKGGTANATVPSDACLLFGPNSPPPTPGQPSPRPTDPDATGGYYLPIVVGDPAGQWSVAPERITCPPSGVTQDVLAVISAGYVPNVNPAIASLSSTSGSGPATVVPADGSGVQPMTVSAGQQFALSVSWASCPTSPQACSGAETYLSLDSTTHTVVTLRESIVASWYATGGSFASDRSGRSGVDPGLDATNIWTAPRTSGVVHLWVVLRDARGGVGWQGYTLKTQL